MTPRLAGRIALSTSLLIHLWLSWAVVWASGCCCAGATRRLSPAALAVLDVLVWPVDQVPVVWWEWKYPVGAILASFELWFVMLYVLLRVAMFATDVRRPASAAA
ncbi:MAG TPA: hypothetical protein VGC13_29340 [Longimicrobium sp.]|jgi:hypothetical protein|uniref:hypothetical protein n=1 Tax=Longimicrobium sp. TaxID=2029185 RepID=UPI002ED8E35D